ncbi:MAG: methyltransferase domain-containing protein [Ignavibacteria bacterium]
MAYKEKKELILFHDKIAEKYDDILSKNRFSEILRSVFHNILQKNIFPSDKILDLGCGTGEDAVFLAKKGITVTALDVSPKMIELAQSKAGTKDFNENLKFLCCDMESFINENMNKFDAIISNFNAINYVEDLNSFSAYASASLTKDGKLIFTVLNRLSISEVFYNFLRLNLKRSWNAIFNRKESLITDLDLYFPGDFSRFFKDQFKIKRITGIGIFIPPHNLTGMYNKLRFAIPFLLWFENLFASVYPFYCFSDHYIIEMQKK